MQRTRATLSCGGSNPARTQAATILAGMSPGGRKSASSTSMTGPAGRQRCRPARSALRGRPASPASDHVRTDSDSSHSPMTLRRYRMRPSTPPSFVKLARRLSSVSTGCSSSTPTSDQVPQEMYAKRSSRAGTPTTAEAVSCEPTAVRTVDSASPVSRRTSGRRRPTTSPGWRMGGSRPRGTPMASRISTDHVAGADVVQPGGRRVGRLGPERAGEPAGEQVRDQQEVLGRASSRRARARPPAGRSW